MSGFDLSTKIQLSIKHFYSQRLWEFGQDLIRGCPRSFHTKLYTGLKLRMCTKKLTFLFLNQNICCGYSKELSQNIYLNRWERKCLKFYTQKNYLSRGQKYTEGL